MYCIAHSLASRLSHFPAAALMILLIHHRVQPCLLPSRGSLLVHIIDLSWVQGVWGRHTQLDYVSDHAHDQEAHANCLADAEELALVGCQIYPVSACSLDPQISVPLQCQVLCLLKAAFLPLPWLGRWSHGSASTCGLPERRSWVKEADVRLLHLVRNCRPSLRKSRGISRSSFAWSILA